MIDTLIVISAHNEADNICRMVRTCHPYGAVLVVDDGSTDNTEMEARAGGALVESNGAGAQYGDGFRVGLQQFALMGYEYVVFIDAGFSYQPADIPRLLARLQAGDCDVVIGSRVLPSAWRKQPVLRWFLTWLSTRYLGGITIGEPLDYAGFRAFTRPAAAKVLSLTENLDRRCHVFNPHLVYAMWLAGLRLVQVPVTYRANRSTLDLPALVAAWWGLTEWAQARKWAKELKCSR